MARYSYRQIILVPLLLIIGFWSLTVEAATPDRPEITVAPFLQNVQIGSEATKSFEITFTNDSSQTQKLALSVADFGSLDETGGVAFVGSEFTKLLDKYTLSPWLSLSTDTLTLAANQKTNVTATVANSSAMGPGGHYAAVVATVVAADGSNKNQVNLKQKISSLVFATKTGGEKYDLRLEKIEHNSSWFKLPNEAYLTLKATGNTHVVPRGIVYLKDRRDKIISKGIINQESGYILPDTSRIFTIKLNKLSTPDFWKTAYYIQVDYRYDGLAVVASKKTGLHYLSPQLVLLAVFGGLLVAVAWQRRPSGPKKASQTTAKKHPN